MTTSVRDLAQFSSREFVPFLPEDSQVNPGAYGAELAYWLAARLAAKQIITSYPEYEDWGWYVEYILPSGSEFAVYCRNIDGRDDRWALALRRYGRAWFGRDKPPYSEAQSLIEALRELLSEEACITDLEWLFDEPSK